MDTQLTVAGEAATPDYGFGVRLYGVGMEQARRQVIAALEAEGFGVVSEIDVSATLRRKLDVDTPPYLILGACDPLLAQRTLATEPFAGLLLPCNVTLWPDGRDVIVTCANPDALVRITQDARLLPIADEAERRLRLALARLD